MGFDTEQFVEPPLDIFICKICLDVYDKCVKTKCGHRFCLQCLKDCIFSSDNCPICRQKLDVNQCKMDETVNEFVQGFNVFCINKEKGCDWKGELRDHNIHTKACEFQEVECRNVWCNSKTYLKDREEHEEECKKKHKSECIQERIKEREEFKFINNFENTLSFKRFKSDPQFSFNEGNTNDLFCLGKENTDLIIKRKRKKFTPSDEYKSICKSPPILTNMNIDPKLLEGRKIIKAVRSMNTLELL